MMVQKDGEREDTFPEESGGRRIKTRASDDSSHRRTPTTLPTNDETVEKRTTLREIEEQEKIMKQYKYQKCMRELEEERRRRIREEADTAMRTLRAQNHSEGQREEQGNQEEEEPS